MIRVIVFDLGKVLLDFDNRLISRRLAKIAGVTEESIHTSIFRTELEGLIDRGKISPEEFFRRVKTRYSLPIGFDDFVPLWCDIFTPVPGMDPLVRELKERYPLGLLSNTNQLHFEYLYRAFPLVRLFHSYHLSYQMGYQKPEPEVFRNVIEHYRCSPEEIFYTDDIVRYVEAARDQGLTAVPFQGADALREDLSRRGIALDPVRNHAS